MDTAIAGAGPTGLFAAIALARRGHAVTIVDRDPGPAPGGEWPRRGVMQFHHPHGLRKQIVEILGAELPDLIDALLAAGAELAVVPADDTHPELMVGMHCGRVTFERVLRAAAVAEPGVTFAVGHADAVLRSRGRAAGLLVDGVELPAELVLDASGRAGRIGTDLRAPGLGADCGLAYVSRPYALLPGAEPGPVNAPIGLIARMHGYFFAAFLQDNRGINVVLARPSADRELAGLRVTGAFEAAMRAIPGLDVWTDPARTRPVSGVLVGGNLRNTYRGQLDEHGRVALPGLVHVGDAVCTTNPTSGRGITTSLQQAQQLIALIDRAPTDPEAVTLEFDRWCAERIKPWFDDHLAWDADQVRQWAGEDVDLSRPLTSGHIVDAAQAEPALMAVVGPYLAMDALPATLAEVEPRAREIFAGGWRPPVPPGPTRDDLAALLVGSST
ncbi:FAD-dependent oxidoreductase [Actinoplanes sp. NPDC049599]|uniref:FAD-dependent oxidoreductase n=1 Tax=Actinoplanes sp. NPDC049599 TaxID=3363903 RepID=UPI0037A4EC9E